MSELVVVKGLHKRLMGRPVLHGIDMKIPGGKLVGLLGPNGSGKTTLLKVLSGLSSHSVGEVTVAAETSTLGRKAKVAMMPDNMQFPSWMRVRDVFTYYRDNFPDMDAAREAEMTQLLELRTTEKVARLSKGEIERVALAATLSRKASLYLLDEPLGGIDPAAKEKVLDAVLATDFGDASVVISTHLLRDIERIFDDVILMKNGVAVRHVQCELLRAEMGQSVEDLYREVFAGA